MSSEKQAEGMLDGYLSQNSLGFDAGDDNFFRYGHNEPTSVTDPSGRTPSRDHNSKKRAGQQPLRDTWAYIYELMEMRDTLGKSVLDQGSIISDVKSDMEKSVKKYPKNTELPKLLNFVKEADAANVKLLDLYLTMGTELDRLVKAISRRDFPSAGEASKEIRHLGQSIRTGLNAINSVLADVVARELEILEKERKKK